MVNFLNLNHGYKNFNTSKYVPLYCTKKWLLPAFLLTTYLCQVGISHILHLKESFFAKVLSLYMCFQGNEEE